MDPAVYLTKPNEQTFYDVLQDGKFSNYKIATLGENRVVYLALARLFI